ncbi:MAG: damage-control phosphatase ARMT1 family protein [bacterium]
MRSSPACFDCGLKQCARIVQLNGGDEDRIKELQERLHRLRDKLNLNEPPGTYTSKLLLATMELLNTSDPFEKIKQGQNRMAMELAEKLDKELEWSAEPLRQALMVSAAGNVIDVGPGHSFEVKEMLAALRFAHDDSNLLIRRLKNASRVVYILDNAGEVIFDRLVLKRLPKSTLTIVARSAPILNDVTVDEAHSLGLNKLGRVIGTGSPYLGVDLGTVSEEFRRVYEQADVVIAKGHANFESLVDDGRDGFYLLTAKCELVAQRLGVRLGDSACFYSQGGKG